MTKSRPKMYVIADLSYWMDKVLAGLDPNIINNQGETLLVVAIKQGKYEYIPELLASGADPRIADSMGCTPLMLLMEKYMDDEKYQIAIALIRHGANPNTTNKSGKTLLHLCANSKNDFTSTFIKLGVNPTLKDKAGKTALQYLLNWVYMHGDALELICAGAAFTDTNDKGETFEEICKSQHPRKSLFEYAAELKPELLLGLQARRHIPDNPQVIFKILLDRNHLDVALALLHSYDKGQHLNANNETMLEVAMHKSLDFSLALLKMNFDPNDIPQGQEPLLKKVLSRNFPMNMDDKIQLALAFIQHGAEANTTNEENENILTLIGQRYPAIHKEMEKNGVNFNQEAPSETLAAMCIADFRIQLKYLSSAHQIRNTILNFIILMAYDNVALPHKKSIFSLLPNELIAFIISFLNTPESNKSMQDILNLMDFIYNNIDQIKTMANLSGGLGGIHVLQRREGNTSSFALFKSAEHLSHLYQTQKKLCAASTEESEAKKLSASCETIKDVYALDYWASHARLFTRPASKLAFMERIEGTELYREIKSAI